MATSRDAVEVSPARPPSVCITHPTKVCTTLASCPGETLGMGWWSQRFEAMCSGAQTTRMKLQIIQVEPQIGSACIHHIQTLSRQVSVALHGSKQALPQREVHTTAGCLRRSCLSSGQTKPRLPRAPKPDLPWTRRRSQQIMNSTPPSVHAQHPELGAAGHSPAVPASDLCASMARAEHDPT